jgi:hypothetical protein
MSNPAPAPIAFAEYLNLFWPQDVQGCEAIWTWRKTQILKMTQIFRKDPLILPIRK